MNKKDRSKVVLVEDLEAFTREPQPMLMVRPRHNRRYPYQNLTTTAEVVEIDRLNLEKMKAFETF
ncbi:MAG: hypothetical protein ACYC7E_17805 [Armatimonadota bacterium]